MTEPQASGQGVEQRCAPTPDQEEGPYYRELVLLRDDLTEGRPGSPLDLAVAVRDARCMPVADVLVDIWHCDALGVYSWYAAVEECGEIGSALLAPGTFLRGSQRTGADGRCRFRTIYPGWYPGRAVHIHAKAHHAGSVLTVQLYFPEEVTDAVHEHQPYASRPRRDTTIDSDVIFPEGGSSTLLTPVSHGRGYRAEAALVVHRSWAGDGDGAGGGVTTRRPEEEPDPDHRLVRVWATAVNDRDADAVVSYSDPEIDCYPLQIATVSGHYFGHEGVRRWLDDMVASDIGHHVRFVGIRTLPDGRVALFGVVLVEGKEISPYSLIATLRDGKVVGMRSYLSDEETMEHLKLLR